MRRAIWVFILSLLISACAGIDALADNSNQCEEEITKFCVGVSPGGARMFNCLEEHAQDLSDGCKAHQAILRRKVTGAFLDCLDDVDQFCKDVRPIGRRVVRCLKQHEEEVSAECKAKLTE